MPEPIDLHDNPEAAAEMAANAVIVYLYRSGITGHTEKRSWIDRVFEMVRTKEVSH